MRSLFSVRQLITAAFCSLFALLAILPHARAFPAPRPLLNPKTVASPSGEFTLGVNPGDRYGVCKAVYRLKHKDQIVWEGARPFTRHTVQLYHAQGHYLRTISLDRAWDRQANYPNEIVADTQGGFLVEDFMGAPSLVWMDAQGRVLRSFNPRDANGKPIDNRTMSIGAALRKEIRG